MTTDPHEAPGVEACCSDCASAVKREWNRVKVAKQKLAIQQERLTLDLQMLKVEKKKLKKNSRLAGKVPSGSDKTETYVGEQATETIPAKTDEMERNSSSPCVKCADKQIELQLMEDAAQLLKVELVQAREELEKEKRESKLTQSRQSNMYEDEVNGLHSSVEQLRRENEGLHAELQQLQEQKGISLAKELENDTRREREHGEMAKINEEKETAEALLEEQSRKLEDLQLLLPSNKAMLDQANAKCNRIQNKYDQLEAKYEDQQELIAELQATKEALVKRQQQQQQDLTELQRAQKEGRIVDIKTTANEYDESEAKDSSPRKHIVTASIPSDMRGETSQTKHVVEWEWTSATGLYGMYTGWLGISGTPDGHGTLRIEDGSIFDGEWRKGLREGHGVFTSIDGDLYRGEWRNDTQHGRGVYVWPDGQMYTGDYVNGSREGKGIETWPHGARYEGDYQKDRRHGTGKYWYPDGRCYSGEYKDDRPNGRGTQQAPDGSVLYDGEWNLGEFTNG